MENKNNNIMTRMTLDSKSLLAQLLASENIIVEHHVTAHTAYFDLQARKLVLPVWENVEECIYDMLIGHEVGHALYTPPGKAWMDAINAIDAKNPETAKSYLNIVEDARIERLMKRKYPGLAHSFGRAYKKMYDENQFGLKDNSAKVDLPLVDRLNLKAKVGIHAGAEVDLKKDWEKDVFIRMTRTETFEDVIDVAKIIYAYSKNPPDAPQQQQQPQSGGNNGGKSSSGGKPQKSGSGGGGSGKKQEKKERGQRAESSAADIDSEDDLPPVGDLDGNSTMSEGDGDDAINIPKSDLSNLKNEEGDNELEDETSNSGGGGGNDDNEDEDEDDSENSEGTDTEAQQDSGLGVKQRMVSSGKEAEQEAPASITDAGYTQFVSSIPKANSVDVGYLDLPEKADFKANTIDYRTVIKDLECLNGLPVEYTDYLLSNFNADNRPYVQYLVKEFDTRKAADAAQRTSYAKSGVLNPSRLHAYKYSEDLFKRMATVRNGKNHGFVMYIDWSSSMQDCLEATIRQLLNLVLFCRRAAIPFEVYAFSDGYGRYNNAPSGVARNDPKNPSEFLIKDCRFLNLMSSRMSGAEMNAMIPKLLHIGSVHSGHKNIPTDEKTGRRQYLPEGNALQNRIPDGYNLHGTPLNSCILAAFKMVPEFQKSTGVQIVNTVILTDGEDSYQISNTTYANKMVIRDRKSRMQVAFEAGRASNATSALIKLLKHKTGCNTVGFYLLESRNSKTILGSLANIAMDTKEGQQELDQVVADFRDKKFCILKDSGYDSYFVIPSDDLDTKLTAKQDFLTQNLSKGKLRNAFAKAGKALSYNRVVLTRFVDIIAKESSESVSRRGGHT